MNFSHCQGNPISSSMSGWLKRLLISVDSAICGIEPGQYGCSITFSKTLKATVKLSHLYWSEYFNHCAFLFPDGNGVCHYLNNPNFQTLLLLVFQTQCILSTFCNDPITSSNDLSSIEIKVIQSCFSRFFVYTIIPIFTLIQANTSIILKSILVL